MHDRSPKARGEGAQVRWRPLFVATIAGYLGLGLVLFTVGECLVNMSFVSGVPRWDLSVSRWLAERRTPWLDRATEIGSRSADTLGIVFVALLVELVLCVRRRWSDLVVIACGLTLELSVFLTVNHLVDRPRPDVPRLGSTPSTFSFPSGHTAATVVVWATIVVLIRHLTDDHRAHRLIGAVAGVIGAVMVFVVGFSRVYRGMHYVTDVVAGALLGAGCVAVAVAARRAMSARSEPAADGLSGRSHDEPLEVQ